LDERIPNLILCGNDVGNQDPRYLCLIIFA